MDGQALSMTDYCGISRGPSRTGTWHPWKVSAIHGFQALPMTGQLPIQGSTQTLVGNNTIYSVTLSLNDTCGLLRVDNIYIH